MPFCYPGFGGLLTVPAATNLAELSMSQNTRSLNYSRASSLFPCVATFLAPSALLSPTGKLRTGFTLANSLLLLEHKAPWHFCGQRWLASAGDWQQGMLVLRGRLSCGRLSPCLHGDIQDMAHGRGWLEAQRGAVGWGSAIEVEPVLSPGRGGCRGCASYLGSTLPLSPPALPPASALPPS